VVKRDLPLQDFYAAVKYPMTAHISSITQQKPDVTHMVIKFMRCILHQSSDYMVS
jgi:hypothetical protein